MPEHLEPEAQHLDDQLAEFTDRLLAGEKAEEFPMSTSNTELASYQEVVQRMQRSVVVPPAPALREKIRARLVAEWKNAGFQQAASPGVQRRGWLRLTRGGRRQTLYRFAFVMVVVLLASFFLFPLDSGLSGTSGGQSSLVFFIVIILVFLLGFFLWVFSRRRR